MREDWIGFGATYFINGKEFILHLENSPYKSKDNSLELKPTTITLYEKVEIIFNWRDASLRCRIEDYYDNTNSLGGYIDEVFDGKRLKGIERFKEVVDKFKMEHADEVLECLL
jgi:hypothetical protein